MKKWIYKQMEILGDNPLLSFDLASIQGDRTKREYLTIEEVQLLVFDVPTLSDCDHMLKTWSSKAGITKRVSYHVRRHCKSSFLLEINSLQSLNPRQVTI